MSGAATFSGVNFQARVIAYVYANILAQSRLAWLPPYDDIPLGISGETDGPGDDAQIEFGKNRGAVEIQAKHGLTGGARLTEAVLAIRDRSTAGDTSDVILIVDRGSSRTIHQDFASDLTRFRSGRTDRLHADITHLRAELGKNENLLYRIHVIGLDIDEPHHSHYRLVMQLLEPILQDPDQASSAWGMLITDAVELCAKRLRRTRKELVDLLSSAGIAVLPPTRQQRFMHHLDLSKRLLAEQKPEVVLGMLSSIEAEIKGSDAEAHLHFRLNQHRSVALRQLGRLEDSLAAAKKSLEFEPGNPHGLIPAAQAAAEIGDLAAATEFIDRAIETDADNVFAWALRAQFAALAGESLPIPGVAISSSPEYQTSLAHIASTAGDWNRVLEITSRLLERGLRTTEVLSLRITALIMSARSLVGTQKSGQLGDAERLASEALEALPEDDPLTVEFLVHRSDARRGLGLTAASDSDLLRARQLDNEDPDALGRLAQSQLRANRYDETVQLLRNDVTENHPALLLLRAQALIATNDKVAAQRDLDAALSGIENAPDSDALRLSGAEVALDLGDTRTAEYLLNTVVSDSFAPEMQAALHGRLAFARGDAIETKRFFIDAAARAPELGARLLAEGARRLMQLDRLEEAIAMFDEVGLEELPDEAHFDYARALMTTNQLLRVSELLDGLVKRGKEPDWSLFMAADIAIQQGDIPKAIGKLRDLANRHPDDNRITFELSRRLFSIGAYEEARTHLDSLANSQSLSPTDQINTAHLLKEDGHVEEAATLALKAFRAEQQDPAMHRRFAQLFMINPPIISAPVEVAANTYVKLADDYGATREYVVYEDEPIDPLRKELHVDDAASAGYLGKRIGDVIETDSGTWRGERWTIAEILPAAVYVFRDVISHYEERFPSEPFFVKMMKLSDESSVKFLAPLIGPLHARKDRIEGILRLYREQILPLGLVARLLSTSIPDLMQSVTIGDAEFERFSVEWFDMEGQDESIDAARHATEVVITRSVLKTLLDLGLLEVVADTYTWIAPHSLREALTQERVDATKLLLDGHRTVMAGDTGLRFEELEPGHPLLVSREIAIGTLLEWMSAHVRVEVRPLGTFELPGSSEAQAWAALGDDSNDALRLASHRGAAMLADDLGLRKLLPKGGPTRSFSIVALLPVLAERGIISTEERDRLLLRLVDLKYSAIVPTLELLTKAILDAHGSIPKVASACSLLSSPPIDLSKSAHLAGQLLKTQSVASVQVLALDQLVQMILEAMSKRWAPGLCAYALTEAAARELNLMPQHLETTRDVAVTFLRTREQGLRGSEDQP